MGPKVKRTMLAMTVVVFLITACVSAPGATEDPELVQIEQTVDALATVQNEPPIEQQAPTAARTPSPVTLQQSANPVFVAQNVQATQSLTSTSDSLQQTVEALFATQNAQSTNIAQQAVQSTGTAQQVATDQSGSGSDLGLDIPDDPLFEPTAQVFHECRITIIGENSTPKSFRLPPRMPQLDLKSGNEVIIIHSVNLRTGPSLSNRIIMALRPVLTAALMDTPNPNTTLGPTVTPRPQTIYKIIGGPAYTNIGDESDANARFSVTGRKYKWWQIELPNKTSGWIVEASACGQIRFIAIAN